MVSNVLLFDTLYLITAGYIERQTVVGILRLAVGMVHKLAFNIILIVYNYIYIYIYI